MDFQRQKANNMRANPRIYLPKPRPRKEEVIMEAKEALWGEVTEEYIKEYCTNDGSLKMSDLTKSQVAGHKSLMKKRKEGEVVVSTTDKFGKMTLSTPENYELQGQKHIRNDVKISSKELEAVRKKIKAHTLAVNNIFRQREDFGDKEVARVRHTMMEQATVIPQLKLTQKDHKEFVGPVPPTRLLGGL